MDYINKIFFLLYIFLISYRCKCNDINLDYNNHFLGLTANYISCELYPSLWLFPYSDPFFQPLFSNGTDRQSINIGLIFEKQLLDFIGIGNLFTIKLSFTPVVFDMYEKYGLCFHKINYRDKPPDSASIVTSNELKIIYHSLNFELLWNIRIIYELGFVIGPGYSYAIKNKDRQTIQIVSPEGVSFSEVEWYGWEVPLPYQKVVSDYVDISGYFPNRLNNHYLYLVLGLQYTFEIDRFSIVPNISIKYPLTYSGNKDIEPDLILFIYSLGIDFKYKL